MRLLTWCEPDDGALAQTDFSPMVAGRCRLASATLITTLPDAAGVARRCFDKHRQIGGDDRRHDFGFGIAGNLFDAVNDGGQVRHATHGTRAQLAKVMQDAAAARTLAQAIDPLTFEGTAFEPGD